jgi:hypothetical protein
MNPARMSSPDSTLGDLLRTALGLYRRGIVPFVALSIVSWLGSTASLGNVGPFADLFQSLPWWLQTLLAVAPLLVGILACLAFTYVTADLYHGQAPGLRDSLGRALGRSWAVVRLALLGWGALLGAAIPFWFVLVAVPALQAGPLGLSPYLLAVCASFILMLPMALALPALQLEPSLGAVGAVKRGWALVRGAWWYTTGVMLLLLIPLGLIGWRTTSLLDPLHAPLLSGLLNAILLIAFYPLMGIVATLFYYERCDRLAAQSPAPALESQRASRSKITRRSGGKPSPTRRWRPR